MNAEVATRLLAIMGTIALGAWIMRWPVMRGRDGQDADPAFTLAQLATYVLVPALLFRTMVRLDLGQLPWQVIQAYFVPALAYALAIYGWQRTQVATARGEAADPAAPATRAVSAVYGNAVQLGIPMALALFGERGLALHVALVALHGLVMLTLFTLLAEADRARALGGGSPLKTAQAMVVSTLTHPVVLPVIAGLLANAVGFTLPAVLDQVLYGLGTAVVPLCLLLIGMNLAQYGLRRHWRGALGITLLKLVVLPGVVLGFSHQVLGLRGLPLQVVVMMGALPVGANALIFGQRYRILQAEATAAIVVSTLAFAGTAGAWLWVLEMVS